jgi:hypothetical protein
MIDSIVTDPHQPMLQRLQRAPFAMKAGAV